MPGQTGPNQVPPGFEDLPYAELTPDEDAGLQQIVTDDKRAVIAGEVLRFDATEALDTYLDSLGSKTPSTPPTDDDAPGSPD